MRRIHPATEADTGRTVAPALIAHDGSRVGPLLDTVDESVACAPDDGAFDGDDAYAAVAARHTEAEVIVPPRSGAAPSGTAATAHTRRDRQVEFIAKRDRMGWQQATEYSRRALIEADVSLEARRRRRVALVDSRATDLARSLVDACHCGFRLVTPALPASIAGKCR